MDLLALAFYLSVLTYCLGLLLRGLPIPFMGIKRLGRSLVSEGVFSCILVFSYRIILYLVEYIGAILGSNWSLYTLWLTERSSILLALITVLKVIGILLSKIGLGIILGSLLNHLINLLSTSLTTLLATSIVSNVIYLNAPLLIAIGITLHAIPFKLARNAGAAIIAMTIVFSIGLPLLPSFIQLLYSSPKYLPRIHTCEALFRLVDYSHSPLGQAVIEGYLSSELAYRYRFSERGELYVYRYQGVPCEEHVVRVDVVNNRYRAVIRREEPGKWNTTLRIPDMVLIAPNRYIRLVPLPEVVNVTRGNNSVVILIRAYSPITLRVITETGDIHSLYVNSTKLEPVEVTGVNWHGVNFTIYSYSIQRGVYLINVEVDYETKSPLNVEIYPYVARLLEIDPLTPENLIYYVVFFFVELTILPIVYIAILFTISLNVARLIGGSSALITRVVVYP